MAQMRMWVCCGPMTFTLRRIQAGSRRLSGDNWTGFAPLSCVCATPLRARCFTRGRSVVQIHYCPFSSPIRTSRLVPAAARRTAWFGGAALFLGKPHAATQFDSAICPQVVYRTESCLMWGCRFSWAQESIELRVDGRTHAADGPVAVSATGSVLGGPVQMCQRPIETQEHFVSASAVCTVVGLQASPARIIWRGLTDRKRFGSGI
jgi:hypothetical protein